MEIKNVAELKEARKYAIVTAECFHSLFSRHRKITTEFQKKIEDFKKYSKLNKRNALLDDREQLPLKCTYRTVPKRSHLQGQK